MLAPSCFRVPSTAELAYGLRKSRMHAASRGGSRTAPTHAISSTLAGREYSPSHRRAGESVSPGFPQCHQVTVFLEYGPGIGRGQESNKIFGQAAVPGECRHGGRKIADARNFFRFQEYRLDPLRVPVPEDLPAQHRVDPLERDDVGGLFAAFHRGRPGSFETAAVLRGSGFSRRLPPHTSPRTPFPGRRWPGAARAGAGPSGNGSPRGFPFWTLIAGTR